MYTVRARQMTDNKRKRRDDFSVTDFENRFFPFRSPAAVVPVARARACARKST